MTEDLAIQIAATEPLDGWCPLDKAVELAEMVLAEKPKLIVEIGVFGGRSIIPMALAAKVNDNDPQVIGIDPWAVGPVLEGTNSKENDLYWSSLDLEKIFADYERNLVKFGVAHFTLTLRMTDEFACHHFKPESIDFLHIDGNHSPEVSMRYVTQWVPLVKPGGVIIFDDVLWDSQKGAVEILERSFRRVSWKELGNKGSWAIYRKEPNAVTD